MKRVSPSVQMQQALRKDLQAGTQGHPFRHFVPRVGELLLQVGLGKQVEACLGRDHCEQGPRCLI